MTMAQWTNIVGVDPSMTGTGIAIYDVVRNATTTHLVKSKAPEVLDRNKKGKKVKPPWPVRLDRHQAIVDKVLEIVPTNSFVVYEGPAYSAQGSATHDIGGIWWLMAVALQQHGCTVLVVGPTSRAKYATGVGNAAKGTVMASVIKRYPEYEIANDNVADAVVFLAIGRRLLGTPIEATLPQSHLEAMDQVEKDCNYLMDHIQGAVKS